MTIPTPDDWFRFDEGSGTSFANEITHVPTRDAYLYALPASVQLDKGGFFNDGLRSKGAGSSVAVIKIYNSAAGTDFDHLDRDFTLAIDFYIENALSTSLIDLFSANYASGTSVRFDMLFYGSYPVLLVRWYTSTSTYHNLLIYDFDKTDEDQWFRWHRLVVTKEGTTVSAYINGVLCASETNPDNASIKAGTTGEAGVGNVAGTTNPVRWDNFVHWNGVALTQAQVEEFQYKITDVDPPVVQNENPANNSYDKTLNTNVYLEIYDAISSVDLSTVLIEIKINNGFWQTAYDGSTDTFVAPFNGPGSTRGSITNGYSFTIDRTFDFAYGDIVWKRVNAKDTLGNELIDYTSKFKAAVLPVITVVSPAEGSIVVDITPTISYHVFDADSGIANLTNNLVINGENVIIDGVIQAGWNGNIVADGTGLGYYVYVTPTTAYTFSWAKVLTITASVEDNAGFENTKTWNIVLSTYIFNAKAFLINSGVETVGAYSSAYNPEIKRVIAGSYGNIALKVTPTGVLTEKSYEIEVKESGRLDVDIQRNVEVIKELGTGQITYTEERVFRGSFEPPKFTIDDGDTVYANDVYGRERATGKIIFGKTRANVFHQYKIIERNDDSLFIIGNQLTGGYGIFAYSIPRIGKIDSNPIDDVQITDTGFTAVASCEKVYEGKYILASAPISLGSTCGYQFSIIDEDATLIENLDINYFTLEGDNSVLSSLDLYSDKNGNIYGACEYFPDITTAHGNTIVFIRSSNGGRNWEILRQPLTREFITIGNPLLNIGIDPTDPAQGFGYARPKLYYDRITEKFVLTVCGYIKTANAGSFVTTTRYVTLTSKDFVNWEVLNYPVFKQDVANLSGLDLEAAYSIAGNPYPLDVYGEPATRLVRFGSDWFTIANDDHAQYMCEFYKDYEIYGKRKGFYLAGNVSTIDKGYISGGFDINEIDGIIYIVSNFYHTDNKGFVVHTMGTYTNVPNNRTYTGAWYGCIATPDDKHGWTDSKVGGPTLTIENDGMRIVSTTGNYTNYNRIMTDTLATTVKTRFCLKPIQDGGYASDDNQGVDIYFKNRILPDGYNVKIKVASDGIRVTDVIGVSNTDYPVAISDFVDILVLFDRDTKNLKVMYCNHDDLIDKWIMVANITLVGDLIGSTPIHKFGDITNISSGTVEYIWKYMLYTMYSIGEDYETGGPTQDYGATQVPANWGNYLDYIPMEYDRPQHVFDNLDLEWRGLDSIKGDKWNFTAESRFCGSNLVNKIPMMVFKTEQDTSIEQTIDFAASNDNLGLFTFDTFVFLNTNMRYVTVKANNDGSTWSPAPFERTIELTLLTGTIAADSSRVSDDLLVVRITNGNMIPGKYKGKYILLEKLFEEATIASGKADNVYNNVAFKILDNGVDFVLISTKGLIPDEDELPGTPVPSDYYAMNVVSGDAFVICDTNIATYTNDIEEYAYLRISIPQSKSYSDAWDLSNQPNLPNERCWQIGEFDFGMRAQLSEDSSYPSTEDEEQLTQFEEESNGQLTVNKHGRNIRRFTLRYDLLSDDDYEILESVHDAYAKNAKPFWYIPSIGDNPNKVYLVMISKPLSSSKMLPEYQESSLTLEEVK